MVTGNQSCLIMDGLPSLFIDRLKKIIPLEQQYGVLNSFGEERSVSIRINTLKIEREALLNLLRQKHIRFSQVAWYDNALILEGISVRDVLDIGIIQQGKAYIQSLSSMLVPIVLAPGKGDYVLDMCAAPGSKTTQIADMIACTGRIVAVEYVKKRLYKLKSVVSLLGADNVSFVLADARRYRPDFNKEDGIILFDKILVDAPCSSEGRFSLCDKKTFAFWSIRKIKEMQRKQKGILLNAVRWLKPSGCLVYATCTFAPEENEAVIDWLLKKTKGQFRLEPITIDGIVTYPAIRTWKGKDYCEQIDNCIRILPNDKMQGFFMAKIVRND